MKISLNLNDLGSGEVSQGAALERLVMAAKSGDIQARDAILHQFMPLLTTMARKRSKDNAVINSMIEKGKTGILHAIRKYKTSMGPEHFQVLAIDHIEKEISPQKSSGFFSRLFGRS